LSRLIAGVERFSENVLGDHDISAGLAKRTGRARLSVRLLAARNHCFRGCSEQINSLTLHLLCLDPMVKLSGWPET